MSDAKAPGVWPEDLIDLPIQPTGSGVADLEVAYEQMKLTEDGEGVAAPVELGASSLGRDDDVAQAEAHPS